MYWDARRTKATLLLLLGHPDTDLNLPAEGGRSALMLACMAGKLDVVEFLLSREGIAINQQDIDGLGHATKTGYFFCKQTDQAAKPLS
jgi:ankyrin repeat protein